MITRSRATIDDLYAVGDGVKAEIVNGELRLMSPVGSKHNRAAGRIYASLLDHEEEQGGGYAFTDNAGFLVRLPNRDSFSPDAAWYVGDAEVEDAKFLPHAPIFAVEVRSPDDCGPQAEAAIREKIRDYFAAGTLVVWDVDLMSDGLVKKHESSTPDSATVFRRGDIADAEPAVPDWRFKVDRLLKR